MRIVLGPVKGIVFAVITYLFAYGSAAQYAAPYQETLVGWAAYKGQTLLLKPGIDYVMKHKGKDYILNAPPNDVLAWELGVSVAVAATAGLVVGLVWAVATRPQRTRESGPVTAALAPLAVLLALVGAFGGVAFAYAAFLAGTWSLRRGGSRRERATAACGQCLGAVLVVVWAVGLAMMFRSSALA